MSEYQCYECGHRMPYNNAIEGDGTCPKCGKYIIGEDEDECLADEFDNEKEMDDDITIEIGD